MEVITHIDSFVFINDPNFLRTVAAVDLLVIKCLSSLHIDLVNMSFIMVTGRVGRGTTAKTPDLRNVTRVDHVPIVQLPMLQG